MDFRRIKTSNDETVHQLREYAESAKCKKNMIHGPCGRFKPGSPCMNNCKCDKMYSNYYAEDARTTKEPNLNHVTSISWKE